MLLKIIRKLTTRAWIAAITFVIGVLLTMWWVIPFDRMEKTAGERIASNLPTQQQIVLPDDWRRLEFDNKVFITLPPDLQSKEPFGDSLLYREVYANKQLHLEIFGHVMILVPNDELRKKRAFPCERPDIVQKGSAYSESVIEIDGRRGKLEITHTTDRGIGATLCFPNADDSVFDLLLAVHCEDEQGLATARQIFSSISFKK